MKNRIYIALLLLMGTCSISCEDYLDVNTNPNGPDALLQPELFLPQIESELAVAIQWDGRFTGFYTQNWAYTSGNAYSLNLHSNPLSDSYAQLWRAVYWSMGYNLSDMIRSGELNEKYGFVGVGYILRAFGWQMLTDYHGPVIVTQAFDPDRRTFDYDEQSVAYEEIQRLLLLGIESLDRTDGLSPEDSGLTEADLIYQGDKERWKKLAYGLLAINAHRLTNKSSYDPQQVIEYVDQALVGNQDNALIRFQGTVSANTNFFGPLRGNIGYYRQTKFILGLLNGSNPAFQDPDLLGQDPVFTAEEQYLNDPRITSMLATSPDGLYRGISPEVGINEWTTAEAAMVPKNFWNEVGYRGSNPSPQIYFFNNDAQFPLMTFSQLQFIKSEAAYLAGDMAIALEAYKEGVNAHLDFARPYSPDQEIYDQRRALMESSDVVFPETSAGLTLSKIMLQKYIATWGWGFFETWSDMRRYHYDLGVEDESEAVYQGFTLPDPLFEANNGNPAYRARPRYNSEYMWNQEALEKLNAFEEDYHTYETWFSINE
ncbi:MAG: SusD/RagB family nutrient-binding outer membrane lipoprotein [Zunongwangia sp.]|nr:SusD/RagB family nutrient-binding outer membrane lipoprotein [Zunongwangia profunda]MAG87152.1 SusD/RagB family nutrient-binding outer membrane lipoprotein [Flavobacteriaceae bacterium]MAO34512.1 SusD/RagB family nutrient-binding outer membrane lipoprotein [Zunongwangia sp.]MAS70568.1 SusD/RagB family nutrient-binding outer membrane lipoprotein [Zunongwangia sp.]MCC4230378.1 SusD/RagB family nutrient-binding outer membrane lipoprotein [Zunongwangia profunda]HCV80071.1 SusD/RagB family nutri|tara:strand:+ start:3292 stop:4917 length:1626 start_codon:yes stop_codon:yes gene_type:complete